MRGGRDLDKFDESAQFGEWPHMCAIIHLSKVEGEKSKVYKGGASLIAPGIVFTAAHIIK